MSTFEYSLRRRLKTSEMLILGQGSGSYSPFILTLLHSYSPSFLLSFIYSYSPSFLFSFIHSYSPSFLLSLFLFSFIHSYLSQGVPYTDFSVLAKYFCLVRGTVTPKFLCAVNCSLQWISEPNLTHKIAHTNTPPWTNSKADFPDKRESAKKKGRVTRPLWTNLDEIFPKLPFSMDSSPWFWTKSDRRASILSEKGTNPSIRSRRDSSFNGRVTRPFFFKHSPACRENKLWSSSKGTCWCVLYCVFDRRYYRLDIVIVYRTGSQPKYGRETVRLLFFLFFLAARLLLLILCFLLSLVYHGVRVLFLTWGHYFYF